MTLQESSMNHQEIEQHGIIDRYLSGELPAEAAARFETHLLECPRCLDEIRWSEDLRQAVRTVAAQDQTHAAAGILAWVVRRTRAQRWTLLAAASLLAVVPPAALLWQQQRLQDELSQARAAARQAERRAEAAQASLRSRPLTAPPPPAASASPARPDLEAALEQERQTAAGLRQQLRDLRTPAAATLIALGFVRSGPGDEQRIHLGGRPAWTVLSVDLPDVGYPAYDAVLRDASGKVLWTGNRIEPTPEATLLLSFPPDFLRPGSYRIQLEGRDPHGEPQAAGQIGFRLLPPGGAG